MVPWYIVARTYLLKAWSWCKKYWQFLVGLIISFVLLFIFRRTNTGQLSRVIERVQSDHHKEIEAIDRARQIEQEKIQAAQARREETVREIEVSYAEAQVELDEKKKKEIKKLVQRHVNNPDELTRQLSRATGVSVWTGKSK